MATGKRRIEEPEYAIRVYHDAKNDIIEIAKWYDLQAGGLGDRFERFLDEAMQKLSTRPYTFSYLFNEVRRIKLNKFPYIIFYKIEEQTVHVYGVIHTKRKPAVYKRRLKKLL